MRLTTVPGLPTAVFFEFGPTLSLGRSTAPQSVGNGGEAVVVGISVSNLPPNSLQYFRAVATNALGTNVGTRLSFTEWNYGGGNDVSRGRRAGAFNVMGDYPEIRRIQSYSLEAGRFLDLLDLQGFETKVAGAPFTASGTDRLGRAVAGQEFPAGTVLISNRQPLATMVSASSRRPEPFANVRLRRQLVLRSEVAHELHSPEIDYFGIELLLHGRLQVIEHPERMLLGIVEHDLPLRVRHLDDVLHG